MRSLAAALILFAGTTGLAGAPGPAAGEPPVTTVFAVTQVTAVGLSVDVRDAAGGVPADLSPADFEVVEDGVSWPVVAVELPPPASAAAGAGPAPEPGPEGAAAAPWQVMVVFDLALAGVQSVPRAAEVLAAQAPALTSLGEVELVLIDRRPEVVLAATRDPAALQEALAKIGRKRRGRQEQLALRQQARRDLDNDDVDLVADEGVERRPARVFDNTIRRGGTGADAGSAERDRAQQAGRDRMIVGAAAQQEYQLLERQRLVLLDFLAAQARRARRALVLVSDGFDARPADFYLEGIEDARTQAALAADLERLDAGPGVEQLAQLLAAEGWVLLPLSMSQLGGQSALSAATGGSQRYRDFYQDRGSTSSGRPSHYLRQPLEPLLAGVEATGGRLALDAASFAAALGAIGRRVRLVYQVDRAPDGRIRPVEVRTHRPGLTLVAPRWAAAAPPDRLAAAWARQVLAGEGPTGDLPVRLGAEPEEVPGAAADVRQAQVTAAVGLDALAAARERLGAAELRVTVAVLLADGRIAVSQQVAHAQDLRGLGEWRYRLPLRYAAGSPAVAVVVDELATGSFGGARLELPR